MTDRKYDKWMSGLNPKLDPLLKRARTGAASSSSSEEYAGVSMALPEEYDYPFPMMPDCKVVHGKIKGPPNHALCGKHGHVLDTKARTVIAKNIAEYNKTIHMEALTLDKNSKDDEEAKAVSGAQDQAKRDHADDLKRYHDVAEGVIVAVTANTTKYSVCVLKACMGFQSYAEPLLEDVRKAEAQDLFGPIFEFALGFALGKLGKQIAEGLEGMEKTIADKIDGIVNKEIISYAKDKLKKKSGVEALKAALQEMVNQANLAADGITKAAEENIAAPLHDISKTAGAGKNLSDDQEKMIKAFVDKDYNSILEGCGLPSAKTSETLQLDIYRGLLQKFQEKLIVQRRLDAGLDYGDPRAVAYDAKKHVDEAVKERKDRIDKEEHVR
jgi:hypothetical protein